MFCALAPKQADSKAAATTTRWKVARTGVEPLRELHAAMIARDAQACIYVAAGEVTDTARAFAEKENIRLVHDAELAKMFPLVAPARSSAA